MHGKKIVAFESGSTRVNRQLTYRLSMHRQSYSCILRKSFHRRVLRECFSSCAIVCIRSLLCVNKWKIFKMWIEEENKNLLFKARFPYFHSIILVCLVHTTHYSKHTRRWLVRDDKSFEIYSQMIGTEAVRRMFVPVWPNSCDIFPQPAM